MNYTKGKWKVNQKDRAKAKFFDHFTLGVEGDGLLVALCDRELWDKHKERLANANLIAAAPDMHIKLIEADLLICELCRRLNPLHENCTSCQEREPRLAALAKAEGKEAL